jgi:hypothetical protein
MRRATSPQAAMRCADIRSVTSSKVTTEPASDAALMRTSRMRRVPPCRISTCPGSRGRPLGRLLDQRRQLRHHVDQRRSDTPSSGSDSSSSAERLVR